MLFACLTPRDDRSRRHGEAGGDMTHLFSDTAATFDFRHRTGRSSRPIRVTFTMIIAAALLLASQAVALAGHPDPGFVVGPERRGSGDEVKPFATLHPSAGNQLQFVEMRGEDGNVPGVGIIEIAEPGQSSTAQLDRLKGANPMEVFNALSLRGAPIPAILKETYGQPKLGPQGWGDPDPGPYPVGGEVSFEFPNPADGDVSFKFPTKHYSYLRHSGCRVRLGGHPEQWHAPLEYGLDNYSDFFLSRFDGPVTKPQHWHAGSDQPKIGGGGWYYDFYGLAESVTGFSVAVQLCDTAHFFAVNGENVGKDVILRTRPVSMSSSETWLSVYNLGKLDMGDKVVSFQYHPPEPVTPFTSRMDIRLEIKNASNATSQQGPGTKGDLFFIGATWQEVTNSDFPTND